jgi:hypothetical protein
MYSHISGINVEEFMDPKGPVLEIAWLDPERSVPQWVKDIMTMIGLYIILG